jgi:uroporphyrinogen decarboxylase
MSGDDWESQIENLPSHMGKVDWAGLAEPLYDGGLSPENLTRIADHVQWLRGSCDRAIMIAFGGNLFEWATFLRRMDNFLMDLACEPAGVERLLDKLVEVHLANLDKLIPVLGDNVDLIQLGDDLGTENGPFFSPQMYRRFFKPRHKMIIDRIKKLNPNIAVFLHSCGGIYELMPDLIEAGFEVINPVQISAKRMDPVQLKKDFGKDVTFWGGGCDTQSILSRGTPQQIKDHVRRNIEIFAPGGGFVFNQVHNVLSEIPPANVVAMYEAAKAN